MTAPAWIIDSADPTEPTTVSQASRLWRRIRLERDYRVEASPDDDAGDEASNRLMGLYGVFLDRLFRHTANLPSAGYFELALKGSILTADLAHTVLRIDPQDAAADLLRSMEHDARALACAAHFVT